MSELGKRLEALSISLDHMGLLVEQILADTVHAIIRSDEPAARSVVDADEMIDRREVEIERECIRLLALYQPAAIDLRRICFLIKVNNDLERIADLCVSSARFVPTLRDEGITIGDYAAFTGLCEMVTDTLHRTMHLIGSHVQSERRADPTAESGPTLTAKTTADQSREASDISDAERIIRGDKAVDRVFRSFTAEVLADGERLQGNINVLFPLMSIGRAFERVGDLCTNIAEDAIFLFTGEIVRHTGKKKAGQGHSEA